MNHPVYIVSHFIAAYIKFTQWIRKFRILLISRIFRPDLLQMKEECLKFFLNLFFPDIYGHFDYALYGPIGDSQKTQNVPIWNFFSKKTLDLPHLFATCLAENSTY
jgi:hypothetical protein